MLYVWFNLVYSSHKGWSKPNMGIVLSNTVPDSWAGAESHPGLWMSSHMTMVITVILGKGRGENNKKTINTSLFSMEALKTSWEMLVNPLCYSIWRLDSCLEVSHSDILCSLSWKCSRLLSNCLMFKVLQIKIIILSIAQTAQCLLSTYIFITETNCSEKRQNCCLLICDCQLIVK